MKLTSLSQARDQQKSRTRDQSNPALVNATGNEESGFLSDLKAPLSSKNQQKHEFKFKEA